MGRTTAWGVIALMSDHLPILEGAHEKDMRYPVRSFHLPTESDFAIVVLVPSAPELPALPDVVPRRTGDVSEKEQKLILRVGYAVHLPGLDGCARIVGAMNGA